MSRDPLKCWYVMTTISLPFVKLHFFRQCKNCWEIWEVSRGWRLKGCYYIEPIEFLFEKRILWFDKSIFYFWKVLSFFRDAFFVKSIFLFESTNENYVHILFPWCTFSFSWNLFKCFAFVGFNINSEEESHFWMCENWALGWSSSDTNDTKLDTNLDWSINLASRLLYYFSYKYRLS